MAPAPEIVGASPPPPGVTPNFDNPESIGYRVIIASVIGPLVTVPICLLRLYTKRVILRLVTYDDYAIVLATVLALGFSITTSYQLTNGLGNHIWDVPADKFTQLMKVGDIAGPIFYNLSNLFTKVSLCLFYLRLSPYKTLQVATYVVMVVSVLYNLITAFGFVWVCHPISRYWDFSITTGYCINTNVYFLSMGCINAATDLALLVLPIFIIRNLHLPWMRKVGVALTLMTGSFVCVVSLIRVNIIIHGMDSVPTDGTWAMVANFIWILIEVWLGIICACLPAMYTFFRRFFPGFRKHAGEAPGPAFPAVKDPNSGGLDPNALPSAHPESGYYSGTVSDFSLGTIDQAPVAVPMNREVERKQEPIVAVRHVASDVSLLSTTSRSNKQNLEGV